MDSSSENSGVFLVGSTVGSQAFGTCSTAKHSQISARRGARSAALCRSSASNCGVLLTTAAAMSMLRPVSENSVLRERAVDFFRDGLVPGITQQHLFNGFEAIAQAVI